MNVFVEILDINNEYTEVVRQIIVSPDGLPVELQNFFVKARHGTPELSWRTATEVKNYGFAIERRTVFGVLRENGGQPVPQTDIGRSSWSKVGFVQGYRRIHNVFS